MPDNAFMRSDAGEGLRGPGGVFADDWEEWEGEEGVSGLLLSGQGGWKNKEKGHDQETNVMKVVHHPIERHVDK